MSVAARVNSFDHCAPAPHFKNGQIYCWKPLLRLQYGGSTHRWGTAIYVARVQRSSPLPSAPCPVTDADDTVYELAYAALY